MAAYIAGWGRESAGKIIKNKILNSYNMDGSWLCIAIFACVDAPEVVKGFFKFKAAKVRTMGNPQCKKKLKKKIKKFHMIMEDVSRQ